MGGWINVGVSLIAAFSFYRIDQTFLMVLSIINAVISFWSFGVMHNFAIQPGKAKIERLRENMKLEGRFDKQAEARLDSISVPIVPDAAPNWVTNINITTFLFGIVFIIIFIVLRK